MQIVLWVSYEEILNKKQKVRETAYNTPVHPQLEYAAPIWDPYTKEKTLQLEKVQRRASRWTTRNYDYRSSVTAMPDHLSWRSLEQRRGGGGMPAFAILQDGPWNCGSTPPRLNPAHT